MQAADVKILGMLGALLAEVSPIRWHVPRGIRSLMPMLEIIHQYGLQGLDLDVEEAMSLHGIIRLIDRLKADLETSLSSPGLLLQRHCRCR